MKTKTIQKIAREMLHFETLETRNSDGLDFHEVSVWGVKDALAAAYDAGRKSAPAPGSKAGTTPGSALGDLGDFLNDQFSPHALAKMASALRSAAGFGDGPDNDAAQNQIDTLVQTMMDLVGEDRFDALCDELGL